MLRRFLLPANKGFAVPMGMMVVLTTLALLMVTSNASAETYEEAVEGTAGITHFWTMGESSGSSFADVVGSANASVGGGVTLGESGGLVGDTSTAALFDGSSGAAHAPVNLSGSGKLTVEFWMKWPVFGDNDALALEFTPNFNENAGGFLVDPSASDYGGTFGVGVGEGSSRNNAFFAQPSAEAWYYYAFVINTEGSGGSEITPYVDGHAVSYSKTESGTGGGFADSTLYWMSRDASSLFGSGTMQDLALYDDSLSSSTILEHYEIGKGGPKASFTSFPAVASAGVPVRLDASASSSPAGSLTDYAWDFDGSKTYSTDAGSSASESHTFSAPGTYTIDLRVKDSLGKTATTSQTITVDAALGPYEQAVEETSDLSHFWPMGESSGSSFADVAGGANASVSGGVSLGEPGGLIEDPATVALFNGSSGAAHASVDLSGAGKETVEFWMKWKAYAGDDHLALEFTPNFNENAGGFLVDPDTPEYGGTFGVGVGEGGARNNVFFARPSAEAWHYYTFVIDTEGSGETEITPYVDGKAVSYTKAATGTGGGFADSTLYWMSRDASSLFGAGAMQDLALYDGALSSNTILEHYAVGKGGPKASFTSSPVAASVGVPVRLDASASSSPVGSLADYAWDFNGSKTYSTDAGGSTSESHTFTSPGTYTIDLRVKDGLGEMATTSQTITVGAALGQYEQAVEGTTAVAHFWPMGESSGSSFADLVGGANATLEGGVTLGQTGGLVEDASTSTLFDGSSGAAHAPVDLSGTHELTVEFWMKWSSYGSDDRLALEFTPNFNEHSGGFLVDPDATPGSDFAVSIGEGASRNSVFFERPSAGAWHYYAFAIDTSAAAEAEITPYVDGHAVAYTKSESGTGAGNFAASTLYWMSRDASSLFGSGDMQDLALYEGTLSADTILEHYEHGENTYRVANTTPPSIEGTAQDGKTLTANVGAWSGVAPISFAYQWQSCNSSGGECQDIEGATDPSYALTSADLETKLRVRVTATNAGGSATVTSAASSLVEGGPPDELEGPSITGESNVGQTLSVDPGLWGGTGTELSYQWERCNATGGECVDIAGATMAEYELEEGDIGATLRLRVGASNDLGSVTALSPATPVISVATLTLANSFEPSLQGILQSGQILTVSPGAWIGVEPITYTYVWERCDAYGSECEERSREDGSTYTLEAEDVGHVIRALVTTTDANGSLTRAVGTEQPVAAEPGPLDTQAPTVAGAPVEGQTLDASPGVWSGTGTIGYAYQWQSCREDGENCTAITGATSASYTPVMADVGASVRVSVTASDEEGSSQGVSSPTPVIGTPAPLDASPPSISGAGEAGEPLSADPGIWSGEGLVSYGYQWRRCDEAGEECSNISGATGETYVPSEADAGKTVKVVVTASDPSGSASATSVSSASISVTPVAPADLFVPAVEGALTTGDTLTAEHGTWYGSEPISYSYQWQRCDEEGEECSNISGATSETYVLAEADLGTTIRVIVTASNSAGSEGVESPTSETVDAPGPPATSGAGGPAIRGEGQVGQSLFAENGNWSGSRPLTFAYRWERCNAAGEACADIEGATSPSYTAASADANKTLRVAVTALNTLGHTAALSPTVAVAASGEASTTAAIELAEHTDPSVLQPSTSATLEEQEVKPATSDPGEELAATTTLTSSSISKETPGEFAVNTPEGELSIAPLDTAANATKLPTIVNDTAAVFAETSDHTDSIVRPEALGATTLLQLRSAEAPTSFSWEIGLGPDQHLEELPGGGIAVVEEAAGSFLEGSPGEEFEPSTPGSAEASEGEGVSANEAEKALEDSLEEESSLEKLAAAPHVSTAEVTPGAHELTPQDTNTQYERGIAAVAEAETHMGGTTLMVIEPPVVKDANDESVPATVSFEGDTVTLTISPGVETKYPVTAQASVAGPSNLTSAARSHTVRYGLSDPNPQSFETSDEAGKIVPGFDAHLTAGPLHVGTARDVMAYNTNPEEDTQFIEWLKAVKKDKLEPFITLRATESEFKVCERKKPCPETSIKEYEHGVARFMSGVIKLYKKSPATIPAVKLWGAWNEPDLNNAHNTNPLHKDAARAALFWKIARLALKNRKCNCTLVAGEFFDYSHYALEYKSAMLKDHKDWLGKPHVWGIHDYYDLAHFWETHRNSEEPGFVRFTNKRLGHPRVWLSEEGVTLQNGSTGEVKIDGHPKRQAEAAEDFTRLGVGPGSRVDRAYYYLYRGPSEKAIKEQENEHLFDSALLPGEEVTEEEGRLAENPRQAYCVLALGKKGCPAKSATLHPVSGTIEATAGQAVLTVDPAGLPSTFWVEYGTTTAYGHSTAAVSAASESGLQSESVSIEGLEPCTTYHYQAEAENEVNEGTPSLGGDQSFTTTCSITFDGSPGTGPPPPTLGGYTMQAFPADTSELGGLESSVQTPTEPLTFDSALRHLRIDEGWSIWSNEYTGDVYTDKSELEGGSYEITLTLPPHTGAFYLYAEPDRFANYDISATAQDGTSSGPIVVSGIGGAQYYGFYAGCGSTVKTVQVIDTGGDAGVAIGEFGIAPVSDGC